MPDGDNTPQGWTSKDKFAAVLETADLNEAVGVLSQARFVRGTNRFMAAGLRTSQRLERRQEKHLKQHVKQQQKETQRLQRELARKEKALAETAVLLVLKKSGDTLGGRRGRMIPLEQRRQVAEWVEDARKKGARRGPCCEVLGISKRTWPRWVRGEEVLEDKRPKAKRPVPANKLSE